MKAIIDNTPHKLTAHAVRRLCGCDHCHGLGDKTLMVNGSSGHDAGLNFHTKCYLDRYGFEAVLNLPKIQRGKFRMCDLSRRQMIQLLASAVPETGGWVRA